MWFHYRFSNGANSREICNLLSTANDQAVSDLLTAHREPAIVAAYNIPHVVQPRATKCLVMRSLRVAWNIHLFSPRPDANLSRPIHSAEVPPAHHILDPLPGPPGLLGPSPCHSLLHTVRQFPAGRGCPGCTNACSAYGLKQAVLLLRRTLGWEVQAPRAWHTIQDCVNGSHLLSDMCMRQFCRTCRTWESCWGRHTPIYDRVKRCKSKGPPRPALPHGRWVR